eukprot:TRINITY_DN2585_c0_g1_i2.p1 TRINITY_DN2585_c0_g1~~TRINITY_DN2585_c0_g1_i2.p1  ORF type:complete len:114 (+),score=16.25 TRINITY_DN2585_c0_g1_i2:436-777(+)
MFWKVFGTRIIVKRAYSQRWTMGLFFFFSFAQRKLQVFLCRYQAIQSSCENTRKLTLEEDSTLIQEVDIARQNLKQTKNTVQRIFVIIEGVEAVKTMLKVIFFILLHLISVSG